MLAVSARPSTKRSPDELLTAAGASKSPEREPSEGIDDPAHDETDDHHRYKYVNKIVIGANGRGIVGDPEYHPRHD